MRVFLRMMDFCHHLGCKSWDWELTVQNLSDLWEALREGQNCLQC